MSVVRSSRRAVITLPDGLFIPHDKDPDARPHFLPLDPPSDDEVASLLDEIIERITQLLKKHGRLDDDLDEDPEPQLLLALRPTRATGGAAVEDPLPRLCARKDGFSLHAGVAIHKKSLQQRPPRPAL